MAVLFRSAAERGLVAYNPLVNIQGYHAFNRLTLSLYPQTLQFPVGSMLKTVLAAVSVHGRRDPTKAHARPSKIRYLARRRTSSGMSSRLISWIHWQSFLVTPSDSLSVLVGVIVRQLDLFSVMMSDNLVGYLPMILLDMVNPSLCTNTCRFRPGPGTTYVL